MRIQLFIVLVFVCNSLVAQVCDYSLDSLLKSWEGENELVDGVLDQKDDYRLKVILSIPCGDSLKTYALNDEQYYYPASLVKLPTVLIALDKMQRLGIKLEDRIFLNSLDIKGNKSFIYKTVDGVSFKELIERTIVVSDNDFYNVLYHFVTPRELNESLKKKGFEDVLIYRCFNGCSKDEQLKSTGFKVLNSKDSLVFKSDGDLMDWSEISELFPFDEGKKVGKRHVSDGKLQSTPYDFNENLEFPITSLHRMMISFVSDSTEKMWKMRSSDRKFLLKKLTQFPSDIGENKYADNDFKIIAFGDSKRDNSRFTTYSKIGYSYGFITESAFVVDRLSHKGFYLTVSMYVNQNGTINDGRYQYSSIATPFMGNLTHIIADQIIDK